MPVHFGYIETNSGILVFTREDIPSKLLTSKLSGETLFNLNQSSEEEMEEEHIQSFMYSQGKLPFIFCRI